MRFLRRAIESPGVPTSSLWDRHDYRPHVQSEDDDQCTGRVLDEIGKSALEIVFGAAIHQNQMSTGKFGV
jgi:hypothetical protein